MNTDLSFITNEENQSLKERFEVLIKDTSFFDCLAGYFYSSWFHAIYPSLESTEKIRILIGISTSRQTFEMMGKANKPTRQTFDFSHAEAKQEVENLVQNEMEVSEDNRNVEQGVHKFIAWIRNSKLEIRAYPSQNIHAKLYIMTFKEGDRDTGRVITGSSNFTQAGLVDNLEFNVELKNRSDYDFAKNKFEELWCNAVDVSEKYVQTIQDKTWLTQNITPYQLYLKFLYEYFKDELSRTDEVFIKYLPQEFKKLEYQEQAVLNAKKILLEYGGVFISDVVGLGKTYISAMLAGQLDGRTLIIAPPVLLEKSNPGSWPNVFSDFRVPADFESLGKLDKLPDRGLDKYTNIIIDEAHRFRTETTISYEQLAEVCRGKRVVLVTATPYNNAPKDILSLLKLFQKAKKSTIPNLPDLEAFFNGLDRKLKKLDRQKDHTKYIDTVRANAREIRDKVLKYLMVRCTRTEIEKYFIKDIKEQGLEFPDVKKPEPLFYELNDDEDDIFNKTIDLIANQFRYARYMPMLYYAGKIDQLEEQSQRNMGRFMKILLVKRLESSFFAFRNSVDRFLRSYEMFIKELDNGYVYVSKKHTNKIFEFIENDDDEAVQRLIDEGKAEKYDSKNFREELKKDLEHDHAILTEVKKLWQNVKRDPKLLKFKNELSNNNVLKKNHIIIFTESKETANYLFKNIDEDYPGKVLLFTGDSGESIRDKVLENFDARARRPKEDYRILIATEVLSEGVNLHRANVVINYDIPWNPARMMQRVGRINRVDTPFDVIHTFNFFPTKQSNDQIKLKEAAEAKINAFLTLLGGDAELLTEGEPIGSHELFDRLISKKTLEGDDEAEESELKYLQVIRDIREKDSDLFEKIKHLPKKARTAKVTQASSLCFNHSGQDMSDIIMYFDPYKSVETKQRNLPHWQQKGTSYFVTFRLYDSIPQEVSENIKRQREQWLEANKISNPSEVKKLKQHKKIEYFRLFSKRYDDLLNNGHGSCILDNKECKQIVEKTLNYFDGERYYLDKFAVMPNHVHVIVIPRGEWTLSKITHSWKSYTANELNKLTGQRGPVWMPESFDHIIRSTEQLERIRQYIAAQASSLNSPMHRLRQDACDTSAGALITYFRRGRLQKFFMAQVKRAAEELDFISAAGLLESGPDEKKRKLPGEMYDLLDSNKEAFIIATTDKMAEKCHG
ncbi:MAG TPA: helicase [Nitrospirae bacterium]|nr:ATP-dependent RNA helicase RhlE [bacterium BMS3Abin06]HDH12843.1 helicase [Nitrospirota bacterium]HDZ01620.1 helicase [Nitrospirota bacterium]